MFFWGALEPDAGLSDLDAWRGAGEWGVSTMNPSGIGDVTVTLFQNPADALVYARERAYQSGELYERAFDDEGKKIVRGHPLWQPERRARARVYYVFHVTTPGVSLSQLTPMFRALRGRPDVPLREGEKKGEMVLVFVNAGRDAAGKIRWKLQRHNSVTVEDQKASAEDIRKAQPRSERISRKDMGKDPRGQKQSRTRLGRPARTRGAAGLVRLPTAKAVATRHELEQRERDRKAERAQREQELMQKRVAEQRQLKISALQREAQSIVGERDYIEQQAVLGKATPKQLLRRDRIIERIDEIQDELRKAGA